MACTDKALSAEQHFVTAERLDQWDADWEVVFDELSGITARAVM